MKKFRRFMEESPSPLYGAFSSFSSAEQAELLESNYARIYQHTKDRHIGIISASREENTPQENHQRSSALQQDIRNHGFGYVKLNGTTIENKGTSSETPVKERSYLVVGKKGPDDGQMKGFLTKHAEKYGQDSVLYKPHDTERAHLIATKNGLSDFNGKPWSKGATQDLGTFHPNRTGEYYSAMKGGKKTFTFETWIYTKGPTFFTRGEYLF